jgi:hypothetical protein
LPVLTSVAADVIHGSESEGEMNAKLTIGIAALAVALAPAGVVSGAPTLASGTLQLNANITSGRTSDAAYCPPGTPANSGCFRYLGNGGIRGLGRVTTTYVKVIRGDDPSCEVLLPNTAVIEVAGKGTLELSREGRTCVRLSLPARIGPLEFTVTGGSGRYGGASGNLTFRSLVYGGTGITNASKDTWTGTLTAPGADFDLTPPTFTGAVSKIVRAPKGARRMRVRYTVRAQDAVDGLVPVPCMPRSGGYFKRGRTKVTCSATDSSFNTRQARFGITVRPRR